MHSAATGQAGARLVELGQERLHEFQVPCVRRRGWLDGVVAVMVTV